MDERIYEEYETHFAQKVRKAVIQLAREMIKTEGLDKNNRPLSDILSERSGFLQACFDRDPRLLKSLDEDVVPFAPDDPFAKSEEQIKEMEKVLRSLDPSLVPLALPAPWTGSKKYISAITDWIEKFKLDTPWMINAIDATVFNRKRTDEKEIFIVVPGTSRGGLPASESIFEFGSPAWNAVEHDMESSLGALANGFSYHLIDELRDWIAFAKKNGGGIARKTRKRKSELKDRYEWLTMRHLLGMTVEEILDDFEKNHPKNPIKGSKTITTETNRLAKSLGLKLRSKRDSPK